MKRVLLTLIAAFAFCGAIFAQTTHWPEFNYHDYENNDGIVAFIQINGEFVTANDDWANLEIGAFVGDVIRGHGFLNDYTDDGDPYPIVEMSFYYDNTGEAVTFMLYDHGTGTLYDACTANMEVATGEDHNELYFNYDDALVLDFSISSITKDIIGYGEGDNRWYLIATPVGTVSPENVENMLENDYDLYSFDQSEELEWRQYGYDDLSFFDLEPGKGYLYANSQDVTLTFPGTAYTEGVTVTLVKDENAVLQGWNLVGNPFNLDAYIDRPFYTMNEDGSDLISEATTGAIAPMEGVFVLAAEDGEEMAFSAEPVSGGSMLALNLTNGRAVVDRAVVRFSEGRTLPKFQLNPNSTKLYIPVDNEDYAVVRSDANGEVPVSFKAAKSGSYTLSFTSEEVSFGYLHLIDNLTGNDVDLLANPSYTFDASSTDYASRFRLVFATGSNDDSFAFFSNGSLIVNNDGNATLQVVDVTGRILSSETVNGCASVNLNAAPGVYMIRLINGDNVKVQKVVVE